jgi:ribonuclease PH
MPRTDGRAADCLRTHTLYPDYIRTAYGSCLIETGGTRVICTASVEESVPPFMRGTGAGWLTAEYAMLPASTGRRKARDGLSRDGRGVEISRLIGRALRQAVDRARMGERTITIDCDVLEADGGTRTAAITGGYVALVCAIDRLIAEGKLKESPVVRQIAAVSAGIVDAIPCLDLCYTEDSGAQTDMNIVMNDQGEYIEIQGTGEGRAFSREDLDRLLALGQKGNRELMDAQLAALGTRAMWIGQKRKLVLASNNAHKLRELREMLSGTYEILSMRDAGFTQEIDETGATFTENAIFKAETVCRATGLLALADDSGLAVDALGGKPGVLSARFAGSHGDDSANNKLLLDLLKGVPDNERTARYICCIALASPFKKTATAEGTCEGTITRAPRGSGGFGYDPYFQFANGLTFAQMPTEEKNAISHRGAAMNKIRELL